MTPEALWMVSVTVPAQAEEAARDLLSGHFMAYATAYCPAGAPHATVSIYVSVRPRPRALKALHSSFRAPALPKPGARPTRIQVCRIRKEDWAQSWKKHFKPLMAGRRLLVRPSWSRRRARPGQRVVVLDPGLSFGTGHHPTTWFCLRQLAAIRVRDGTSLLDLGTGSGILAIAAAKLGYHHVEAIDHDPDAIRVARRNVRRNRVEAKVRLRVLDLRRLPKRPTKAYTVVCANLTSDLLVRHRHRITSRVAPGGVLLMAGVLRDEFGSVAAAYTSLGFLLADQSIQGEWRSGAFIRSAPNQRSDTGGGWRRVGRPV